MLSKFFAINLQETSLHIQKQSETATRGVLWKKVLLEISQNSQENPCAKVFFKKAAGLFIEKETLAQVFS